MEKSNRSVKSSSSRSPDKIGQGRTNRRRNRSPFLFNLLPDRRKSGGSKTVNKKSSRQPVPVTRKQPPVVARGYNADVSWGDAQPQVVRRKGVTRTSVRRRFDVPLSVPGAEMRLPSVPLLKISRQWIPVFILAVLVGGLYILWRSPVFRVESPEIYGVHRIRSGDVIAVLDLNGKSIIQIQKSQIEQKLLSAFPEFSSVVISVSLPNKLSVTVSERKPILTWRQPDGIRLVAADGYAFPVRMELDEISATGVISPLVEATGPPPGVLGSPEDVAALVVKQLKAPAAEKQQGEDEQDVATDRSEESTPPKAFLTPDMVQAVLIVAEQMPQGTTLLYDSRHGLGWKDGRGWQVYMGNAQDMAMKLRVYDAIIERLLSEGNQPQLVSVEYIHNPYFQLAPQTDEDN